MERSIDFVCGRTYDKNGNILLMKRKGRKAFPLAPVEEAVYDDLSFSYDGNQLVSVSDVAEEEPVNKSGMQFADGADEEEEYEYDANGNMVSDKNKGIGKIMYNTLNLPETVAYSDDGKVFNYQFWLSPLAHINSVNFTYAADGTKLESSYVTYKELTVPSIDPGIGFADSLRVVRPKDRTLWLRQENTMTYAGNYQYENDTLSKKFFADGYIDCSGGEPVACFYLKDHLGNVRMVVDENGGIVQVNDYYPFGALYGSGTGDAAQRYKYNGKELEWMHGLDWYDYGARWMDPVLCRFTTMDPLCEKYYDTSPYAYCANNPMKYIDPDGEAWRLTRDDYTGEYTGYQWVDPEYSYNEDGTLKPGLYEQAIFFSDNGTFNANESYNIGSSTATVYLNDNTIETFDACTYPSQSACATVPAGKYEARVGLHKGQYTALRMSDIGGSGKIELGQENPAYSDGRTYATGINIHKPGSDNFTGVYRNGSVTSAGCLLIDINRWSEFIGLFEQNTLISVTVSRSLSAPTNRDLQRNIVPLSPFTIPREIEQRANSPFFYLR